ncbi:MAG: exodeoxyribonuclease VII small subunit [Candidatus Methanomethylophilaceae archaeon]|nr:exodeoxyribonuclease VII small subunit [Candidatus Methanomethylophilaceae archaeon]MBR2348244.1 exodeoxyribonuclease VII small subunit [Candidatus Methanomethylophilaceae archaeon]MBR2394162.1 exodeoxyribonuclease VII small subunit [Candidatus Methanomethylophilaceae archaeon]
MNGDFAAEVESMTFEQSMKALEELVSELEAGGIDLDRSIEVYEKAVILRNRCRRVLDESERRIKAIMETSGTVVEEDFDVN